MKRIPSISIVLIFKNSQRIIHAPNMCIFPKMGQNIDSMVYQQYFFIIQGILCKAALYICIKLSCFMK